ncbi:hypothetical protein N0V93_009616 [Gnomoniopsis smithogilvyi]|uniref:Roadblock/LAMTOR2 domain-containing protein n=1 Tax=Gnomoniopsis smithogilvyi TaxID=1191159 RepID=A0A9W8YMD2_9PEZI|nr:hypothetical protein N0V93_009616 [Gnomoniopsis smithogilvyi]
MVDPTPTNGIDALEETLGRLSKKPGVKATIALDRTTGSILKTAGQISLVHTPKAAQQHPQPPPDDPAAVTAAQIDSETQGAEELAGMVWKFVNAAGGLVAGLDGEDELKLLRVRTKKQELVIVPDVKYLLIVIHETPAA